MELKEIIAEIIEKKFSELPDTQRPRALAKVLDVGEMDARRLIVAGRNQEKQFAIFMKLLPLCRDLGINPARELIDDQASHRVKGMKNARMLIEGIGKADAVSKDVSPDQLLRLRCEVKGIFRRARLMAIEGGNHD